MAGTGCLDSPGRKSADTETQDRRAAVAVALRPRRRAMAAPLKRLYSFNIAAQYIDIY
jgi:hypothetical protein